MQQLVHFSNTHTIPHTIVESTYTLWNPEQIAMFACCGIREKTNEPTSFTLIVFVRGFHKVL